MSVHTYVSWDDLNQVSSWMWFAPRLLQTVSLMFVSVMCDWFLQISVRSENVPVCQSYIYVLHFINDRGEGLLSSRFQVRGVHKVRSHFALCHLKADFIPLSFTYYYVMNVQNVETVEFYISTLRVVWRLLSNVHWWFCGDVVIPQYEPSFAHKYISRSA